MKFPSFIKTAKYGRFNYEPRYYDPIKEEIQGKIAAAKRRAAAGETKDEVDAYSMSISAAFAKRERKSNQTSWMQLSVAAGIMGGLVLWWYQAYEYALIVLVAGYIFFKFKQRAKKKSA